MSEVIAEKSGKIGEKITLRRFEVLNKKDDEVFGTYFYLLRKKKIKTEWYVYADEALENGVCDRIIENIDEIFI